MKKYTIVADPRVADDLKEARDFLNSRRKGFGAKFLTEYRNTLKSLQNNPLFQIRYKEVHCLPMKTFKYMIHFEVDENSKIVHIYAVLSTHQDPNKHWL
jgi:mRNA-degrading endonuclease RelE of RelBE toxin-antitoxin system